MIQERVKEDSLVMEIVTDPVEGTERWDRFERNWAWFEAHASEIYARHRGKCYCIAGEHLFVADTPEEVLAQAKALYPQDNGRFTGYIPREKVARIYAN